MIFLGSYSFNFRFRNFDIVNKILRLFFHNDEILIRVFDELVIRMSVSKHGACDLLTKAFAHVFLKFVNCFSYFFKLSS